VLKGNRNINLSPASSDWLGYIGLLLIGSVFIVLPIYLAHRFMQDEKERVLHEFASLEHVHATSSVAGWRSLPEDQQRILLIAQVMMSRLTQVRDWPITADEVATVFFTYFLGTTFTILSSLQGILDFLSK